MASAARQARAAAARADVEAFVPLVMKDPQGRSFSLAPMHRDFHALAEKHRRLVLMSHFESGKTENLAIARTLWELGGRDQSLTFAIISKTENQGLKTVRRIREIIETSAELRMVFPHFRPGRPWGDSAFSIDRPHGARTPSVQAFGIDTAILGDRVDRMILDDISDWEIARTEAQRQATTDKCLNHLFTRVTARGKVVVCGVPFHVEDTISTLGRLSGWHLARFPVEDDAGRPRWPAHWSPERIAEARATLGPAAAARQLDLNPVSDADGCFAEADITRAIQRGERSTPLSYAEGYGTALLNRAPAFKVIIGCDPAISLKPTSDLSALVAILVHPDGSREVLSVDAGRWPFGSLVDHIDKLNARFVADACAVETNQAQEWLAQQLGGNRQIRVLRHTTGRGQMSLAFEAEELARELRNGQWIFPSTGGRLRDPEVAALVRDLSLMTRADKHVPDRVAALLMCRWATDQLTRWRVEQFSLDTLSR